MNTWVNLAVAGGTWLFPAAVVGIFSCRLRFQKDLKVLPEEERHTLETKVQELAHKLKICKKLEIREISGLELGAQAMGNVIFPGRAGVIIDPYFFECLTPETQEFFVAHEISHIKHHDSLTLCLVAGVASMVTTIALSVLFPRSADLSSGKWYGGVACSGGVAAGMFTYSLASQWREKCADKTAFSVCSPEAQAAAIEFFEDCRSIYRGYRNEEGISFLSSVWRKTRIMAEGEDRLDILHPFLKDRINYLKEGV
ncbi:M48 family metalloprotease [Parachlamydia sp. AcF125]|uniref:M48 family metalloprotease n=1 Tax=Parachlamydia sp. AcF125 TaxID=2795736 RepID=UPI001BCA204B|nr:M48 family metalloprotease [Parachlamydia sp. AcF125]MBS4168548.1 Protease HtpX [Parachlamydia sp. AcF125]